MRIRWRVFPHSLLCSRHTHLPPTIHPVSNTLLRRRLRRRRRLVRSRLFIRFVFTRKGIHLRLLNDESRRRKPLKSDARSFRLINNSSTTTTPPHPPTHPSSRLPCVFASRVPREGAASAPKHNKPFVDLTFWTFASCSTPHPPYIYILWVGDSLLLLLHDIYISYNPSAIRRPICGTHRHLLNHREFSAAGVGGGGWCSTHQTRITTDRRDNNATNEFSAFSRFPRKHLTYNARAIATRDDFLGARSPLFHNRDPHPPHAGVYRDCAQRTCDDAVLLVDIWWILRSICFGFKYILRWLSIAVMRRPLTRIIEYDKRKPNKLSPNHPHLHHPPHPYKADWRGQLDNWLLSGIYYFPLNTVRIFQQIDLIYHVYEKKRNTQINNFVDVLSMSNFLYNQL